MTDKALSQQAKDELSQIKKNDSLIRRMLETVIGLRSSLTSINAELKPDKVQSSHKNDQMAATIAKIVDLECEMNAYIDNLIDLKRDTFRVITKIPDPDQQNVLIARYLQLKKWDDIAEELEHEIRWIYRIHGKALVSYSKCQ